MMCSVGGGASLIFDLHSVGVERAGTNLGQYRTKSELPLFPPATLDCSPPQRRNNEGQLYNVDRIGGEGTILASSEKRWQMNGCVGIMTADGSLYAKNQGKNGRC